MIFARGDEIVVDDLPQSVRAAAPRDVGFVADLRTATAAFERAHILRVIDDCGGNKRRAARLLGLGVTSLYRKLGSSPNPVADDAQDG